MLYRMVCGTLFGWSTHWVLASPESVGLVIGIPEMATLGPLAGVLAGSVFFAARQDRGAFTGIATGVWTGLLAMVLASLFYVPIELVRSLAAGGITDLHGFLLAFGRSADALLLHLAQPGLLVVLAGVSAITGLAAALLSWLLSGTPRRKSRAV